MTFTWIGVGDAGGSSLIKTESRKMRSTRKKVIKTVYKDDNSEDEEGDFTDSGSDAKISDGYSSEDDVVAGEYSSADEFQKTVNKVSKRKCAPTKTQAKSLVRKISKQINNEEEIVPHFSIKDLTEADKLLPPILNLSESDSSDDESPKVTSKNNTTHAQRPHVQHSDQNNDSDMDVSSEYKDVWSHNVQVPDNSEEIAKKTFMELEQHKSNVEETKAALQNYQLKTKQNDSDVKDLLAMGEEQIPEFKNVIKKHKFKKRKNDSESEMEDWEEVKETKEIPQQGIQLFVEFPDGGCRKSKQIDVEMMMKRKINRVKKEYQVYMHKVHVLCWLGHGNYISRVLNDQELMAAALSLVPSKECYPSERVDMKYVEQITTWYKDKLTLKPDKNEDKFKPKAPPLKTILLGLIQKRIVTSKKYLVFIFVTMLRALGLQCRVMFNFVTLPIKPPHSELCSLSTKPKDTNKQKTNVVKSEKTNNDIEPKASTSKEKNKKLKIAQLDGNDDSYSDDEEMVDCCYETQIYSDYEKIMQVDGNDDTINTRSTRSKRTKVNVSKQLEEEDVSPPKIAKKSAGRSVSKPTANSDSKVTNVENRRSPRGKKVIDAKDQLTNAPKAKNNKNPNKTTRSEKEKAENNSNEVQKDNKSKASVNKNSKSKAEKPNPIANKSKEVQLHAPKINVVDENNRLVSSNFFEESKSVSKLSLSRKRSQTANPGPSNSDSKLEEESVNITKTRTKSAPGTAVEKSKYFDDTKIKENSLKKSIRISKADKIEDKLRVSHKDLTNSITTKKKNDIIGDLVNIVKNRIKDAKSEARKGKVKGNIKEESDDSDYLPIEDSKRRDSDSGEEFKPTKITPKPNKSARRIDRRVISTSTEEGVNPNKTDVWCEIFVEELEQWISVDVIKGKIHSTGDLYTNATHPVCYIVGWDNNNYLKDLTRKYVPQYNTVTRKIRAEPSWWNKAISSYLGPKTARDREEDEYLDRMQLEAPLPKSIAEYKNHPLYALKRHLLKYEAIYPPDAATLGFVRNEPVYARECVYVCRSRDTWLKEAKVVRLGEKPYKIVKARPKWDKLSNKLITDKPLEVFGPWQVQDYEPPVAENGIVPRNAYGNVELFKECMLPKGTVHIKLPSLNRVARKLNIDCAPAMTGFDFNGGWSHPVYDGFVVCQEFAEIVTDAWVKDQEEQERREREKIELRVYGNWKKLIKGLLIRERLKHKYGFEEPITASTSKGKSKAPRLVIKKK